MTSFRLDPVHTLKTVHAYTPSHVSALQLSAERGARRVLEALPESLSAGSPAPIKHSSCFERVVGARHTRREVEVERDGRRPAQAIADIEQVASQEEEEQEGHEEEDGGADGVPM